MPAREVVQRFVEMGDLVVIRWRFALAYADGRRTALDEIAWQRWSGSLVAEERFYYDPAQHKVATAPSSRWKGLPPGLRNC